MECAGLFLLLLRVEISDFYYQSSFSGYLLIDIQSEDMPVTLDYSLNDRTSVSDRGEEGIFFFSSPLHPDRLCGSTSLVPSGVPWGRVKLPTHLHPSSR
jgi:hypothetical protein